MTNASALPKKKLPSYHFEDFKCNLSKAFYPSAPLLKDPRSGVINTESWALDLYQFIRNRFFSLLFLECSSQLTFRHKKVIATLRHLLF